jgi:PII-like signaling protein
MKIMGRGLRLTIWIGADDIWHHKPLSHEIVRRAREAGLAGATVLHGVEGYGSHSVVHTVHLLSMIDNLPLVIVIVDSEDSIRAFLPQLDELVNEGMVTLDQVESIRYADNRKTAHVE